MLAAVAVAVWFFCIDWANGRPLLTPTVLWMALVRRDELLANSGMIAPSLAMTLMFTIVHTVSFALMGFAAARVLREIERTRNIFLIILILAAVFQFLFVAFALTVEAAVTDVLGWPEVVIGNLLAAVAMGTYLWRRHPNLHPRQ
jgi:hypothetical protein